MARKLQSWRLLVLPVVALVLFGCGDDVPKTADQAVLRVVNGLAENKPQAAWEALPASYQKDVNDCAREAISAIDAELWNKTAGIVQRLAKILRDKKQFIMGGQMMAQNPDKAKIEASYDNFVEIFETLANSELAKHEQASKIDVGAFTERTLAKVMDDVTAAMKAAPTPQGEEMAKNYEELKKTKATLISEEGDTAKVKIETPGEPAEEMEFKRVEGKWLPKEMVDGWAEGVKSFREEVKQNLNPESMKQAKEQMMPLLNEVDKALASIEAANDQASFDAAVGQIMQKVMGMFGGGGFDEPGFDDDK